MSNQESLENSIMEKDITDKDLELLNMEPEIICHEDENPWPYLHKFFTFKFWRGNIAVFSCILCLPKHVIINGHRSSPSNLKGHVKRKHFSMYKEFVDTAAMGSFRGRKKKPTIRPANQISTSTGFEYSANQQMTIDHTFHSTFGNVLNTEVPQLKTAPTTSTAGDDDEDMPASPLSFNPVIVSASSEVYATPKPRVKKPEGEKESTVSLETLQKLGAQTVVLQKQIMEKLKPSGDREREAFAEWIRCVILDLDRSLWRRFQQQISSVMYQFMDENDRVKIQQSIQEHTASSSTFSKQGSNQGFVAQKWGQTSQVEDVKSGRHMFIKEDPYLYDDN